MRCFKKIQSVHCHRLLYSHLWRLPVINCVLIVSRVNSNRHIISCVALVFFTHSNNRSEIQVTKIKTHTSRYLLHASFRSRKSTSQNLVYFPAAFKFDFNKSSRYPKRLNFLLIKSQRHPSAIHAIIPAARHERAHNFNWTLRQFHYSKCEVPLTRSTETKAVNENRTEQVSVVSAN